ncbi:LysE family translocator [Vibrio sp. SM6]|uniref:LysE family translocator n=1 Tax=Vibrio agarilyticus TaxID=2726741 RepID=A0A7X8YIC1_9VIBR|nr:LysE family translocator [Vibrio agarilyticus]NLS14559.1 LysE family translocator [Vibrio agarilyticus]
MIDLAVLPMYLTAMLALFLVPGPDMLLITSTSMNYGKRVGFCASLGTATSGIILTVLAAIGVSAVIAMNPMALQVMHLVGGAYLLKMGWDSLRCEASDVPALLQARSLARTYYRRALFNNLLNPKVLVFFVMFLPQFVSPKISASTGEQMMALGMLLNVAGFFYNLLLVIMAGTLGKKLLENSEFRRYQHKVMGGVFILLACWMLSHLFLG